MNLFSSETKSSLAGLITRVILSTLYPQQHTSVASVRFFFYRRKDINFHHYLHYFKQCQSVHSCAWRVVLIHWRLKSFVPSEEPIELTVQTFQISEVNKNTFLQGHFLLQIPNFMDIKNHKTDSPGRIPLSKFAHKSKGNKPLCPDSLSHTFLISLTSTYQISIFESLLPLSSWQMGGHFGEWRKDLIRNRAHSAVLHVN